MAGSAVLDDAATVAGNVRAVLAAIRRAAVRAGRDPESVRLVAATKQVGPERITPAIEAGVRLLGENRLQEALPKIEALAGRPVRWHFIGRLQRRKVREVVGRFELIHSVDSVELAAEIERRAAAAGLVQPVLLEVNLGGEASKGGFDPEGLPAALPELARLAHVRVRGLMAIPPPTPEAEGARPYFRRLRLLAESLGAGWCGPGAAELSMGMSQDYEVAVEEGATMVRVGTALFGRCV
jgi:pyridoxal phosphate enzyme (YggS family)